MFCTGLAAELGLSALILLVVGSGNFFMELAGTAGAFHCIGYCGQSCCGTRFSAGLGTVTGCTASLYMPGAQFKELLYTNQNVSSSPHI
ncbi:hypothetical protein EDC04DRAFT_2766609, partial [Pisolithus marmoratus]